MQATFQRVWDDFSHLPKSVLFKTMGYSPGFLLKIGRFRTLANSHRIFTNMLKNSLKYTFKHDGDVSESLGRFLKLTKIRRLQNHGLQPRLFAQNRSISDTCEFSRNLYKQAQKQLEIHLQACRRRFREFGRFLKLTKIRPLQNHGLQPRLFAQNRSISDPCEFSRNLQEQAQKQSEIHLQAWRRRFRKFGTISRTYQNPPSSKQWAIAQAFCSKSVDFGSLRILTESLGTSPKTVRNQFASMQATFQRVWDDFSHFPKSALFKTMGYSPGFLLKIGRFRTLANSHGIFRNKPKNSQKSICKQEGDVSESLGRFFALTKIRPLQHHVLQARLFAQNGSISDTCEFSRNLQEQAQKSQKSICKQEGDVSESLGRFFALTKIRPLQIHGLQPRLFCSKSVDFGHLRILTESLQTSPKTVRNPFSSMQGTFQRVWDDFSHLPKSALFKTMGYSPGVLLKIGEFRTLANSHGIFTNMFKNSSKSTFKHAGDVSESLGRFLALSKIRPLQNHGLQPRLFAQNRSISDTCEFSRNLYKQAQKQLEIHFQVCRGRFREFGTISRTYQNPPSSKPWAIAQAFCSKWVNSGHLRILTESLGTTPKTVRNPFASMQATFQKVWDDFSHLPKSAVFKTMGYSPGFLLKIGRFRTLANSHGIFTKMLKNSCKSTFKHDGDVSESLGRFLALTKIRPLQNHGLQPRLFCSKSVDFGHLRILTESLQTSPKTDRNPFSSMQGTFQRVWDDFSHLPKSALFKTMGYSPGVFAQNR